jgi:hypothetical protein
MRVRVGLRTGVRTAEQVPQCLPPEQRKPAPVSMLGPVVPQVTYVDGPQLAR